ncbi:unnamed protein product [Aphanomyces euteiches]
MEMIDGALSLTWRGFNSEDDRGCHVVEEHGLTIRDGGSDDIPALARHVISQFSSSDDHACLSFKADGKEGTEGLGAPGKATCCRTDCCGKTAQAATSAREKGEKSELLKAEQEMLAAIHVLMKKFKYPVVVLNRLPPEIKEAVLENRQRMRMGQDMKKRLEELYEVQKILAKWVFAHNPHEGVQPKPTMMETTLLGHDRCRSFGQQWLCEKALRMALTAHPYEQFKGKVEDSIVSWPHLSEDDTGTSLEAVQFHSQYSVMGDYRDVADVFWDLYVKPKPQFTVEMIDKLHDEMLYFSVEYGPLKSRFLNLACLTRLKHRIVVTLTTIAFDERFPMNDDESRIHGVGWCAHGMHSSKDLMTVDRMILDEMGEGVTLCRQSCLQYTPVKKSGPLTLEEIGQLVHYEPKDGEPREIVIGKYQEMTEVGFTMQRDLLIRPHFPIF